MSGLRELRVRLGCCFYLHPEIEIKYLNPLRMVRRLDVFEVEVTWQETVESWRFRDAPFVLRRRNRNVPPA
jgi:hypothetical protein